MATSESIEWTTDRVRSTFVNFFVEKLSHTHVPSSPVVPAKDPTLLFANSGMTQFKPIFLNEVNPQTEPELARLKRAANSQKCIRAGGKHNDLDDVGKDTYHHTFFEMLGNWSFGDYFKKEAIDWAWELLTQVYGLEPDRLYATYYAGNEKFNVPIDNEARELWLRYLPASRVLPFEKENFWEMGETGPCGPCSEIHYDRIGGRDAASLVNMDDPDVIEIWNLVFMQYNRVSAERLDSLPHKHVDTGAGLERVTSILQNKRSNYDIDLFQGLFRRIHAIAPETRPYLGHVGAEDADFIDTAYRVVADHARTLTFAIADGCVPSNTRRGYVLRRILRRAVYYLNEILKAPAGSFRLLIAGVAEEMQSTYGYLLEKVPYITNVVAIEEDSFNRNLKAGIRRFESATNQMQAGESIPGTIVFKLYDTFGFPVDLTTRMAEQRNLKVDTEGFEKKCADAWKRGGKVNEGQHNLVLNANALEHLRSALNASATNDRFKYESDDVSARVVGIFVSAEPAGNFVDSVSGGSATQLIGVVTDVTNFYGEQGGQIYDTGVLTLANGTELEVSDAQLFGEFVLHVVEIPADSKVTLSRGDNVTLVVDRQRRAAIMSNHTATHMVNHSLRQVIGDTCQAGSLVTADQFRFDFKHGSQLTPEESERVEAIVRDLIQRDLPVNYKEVPKELATSIHGVQQLFSERYPDIVRVVAIGVSVDDLVADVSNASWPQYSIEFCSGTHIARTSEAREFTITSCRGLEAGVRRLEALTGEPAIQAIGRVAKLAAQIEAIENSTSLAVSSLEAQVRDIEAKLNDAVLPYHQKIALRERVTRLRSKALELGKDALKQSQQAALERADQIAQQLKQSPQPYYVEVVPLVGAPPKVLSSIVTKIQEVNPSVAVLLICPDTEKKQVQVVSSVLTPTNLKANDWAKHVATSCGGNGGGKPTTAQAKFSDLSKVELAEQLARDFAATHL